MREPWESPDNLPTPGERVLFATEAEPGGSFFPVTMGFYLPKLWRNTDDEEFDGDCDWNKEGTMSYWPEGWYEEHFYGSEEYQTWSVNDPVVAWMPLPRYEP